MTEQEKTDDNCFYISNYIRQGGEIFLRRLENACHIIGGKSKYDTVIKAQMKNLFDDNLLQLKKVNDVINMREEHIFREVSDDILFSSRVFCFSNFRIPR